MNVRGGSAAARSQPCRNPTDLYTTPAAWRAGPARARQGGCGQPRDLSGAQLAARSSGRSPPWPTLASVWLNGHHAMLPRTRPRMGPALIPAARPTRCSPCGATRSYIAQPQDSRFIGPARRLRCDFVSRTLSNRMLSRSDGAMSGLELFLRDVLARSALESRKLEIVAQDRRLHQRDRPIPVDGRDVAHLLAEISHPRVGIDIG